MTDQVSLIRIRPARVFELEATLAGVPLYRSLGYREVARYGHTTPDGATLPVVRMEKVYPIAMRSSAFG